MQPFTVFHCSGACLSSLVAAAIRTGSLAPGFPLSEGDVRRVMSAVVDRGRIIYRGDDTDGNPVYSLARGCGAELVQTVLVKGTEALGYPGGKDCAVVAVNERLTPLGLLRGPLSRISPRLGLRFTTWLVNTNARGILESAERAGSGRAGEG